MMMKTMYDDVAALYRPAFAASTGRFASQLYRRLTGGERDRLMSRIRDLEAENSRLSQLAITDELTGAFNRRHLDDVFKQHLFSQRSQRSLAFCLFDIDNFKAYNDLYGHSAGDDALRLIARAVGSQLRQQHDSLFRLGGDEFGILLSSDSPVEALHVVERSRVRARELALSPQDGKARMLTLSFGVVWRSGRSTKRLTPSQFYLNADRMLYEAKRAGRDQVRLAAM